MKFRIVAVLCFGLVTMCGAAPVQTAGFTRIASELDMGGDYFEVVNAPTFRSDIEAVLDFLVKGMVESGAVPRKDLEDVRKVREVLTSSGFLSLRGQGSSVCAREDGSFVHRSFVLTEKGKAPIFDLFACGTRPATVEAYLPRTTAAALSFSLGVKETALYAADVMKRFAVPQAGMVEAFCEPRGDQPSLADCISPGTLVALTLDTRHPWQIPGEKLLMPTPGLLVVQAVRNGQIWALLKMGVQSAAQSSAIACSQTPSPDFPDMDRLVFTVPEGKQWNVTPACAYDRKGGVIVFASSVELLDAALAAGVKKEARLLDDATFRAHAAIPREFSGFAYLAPQVVPVLADFVRQGLAQEKAPVPPSVQKFLADPPSLWYTGAFTRVPDGLKAEGRASFGACNTLRLLTSGSPCSTVGMAGVLMGALFPAVSQAQLSAQTSAMAMRGRNLFVGLIQANTERETAGLGSAWPRTAELDDDKEDISGRAFGNGCDYFGELFDLANYGKDDWKPYVGGVDLSVLGSNLRVGQRIRAAGLDWCVAANVTDEMDDVVPVLVSANFNPELLLAKWNGRTDARRTLPIGPASGAAKSLFGDKAIVVVRKGGASQVIQAKYLTYSTLYNRQAFDATQGKAPLVYLTPTGVAVPAGRR